MTQGDVHVAKAGPLEFDTALFSPETVKRALYRFADQCSFDFCLEDRILRVTLRGLDPLDSTVVAPLCDRIRNEVLDQALRDSISQETANVRTLILANAFSNSGLIDA